MGRSRVGHLVVGPASWLYVAGEVDGHPRCAVAVAAIDRIAVERLAPVREHQVAEGLVDPRRQARRLLVRVDISEVGSELGQTGAVVVLPADDRTVELALRTALRALDAHAP